MEQANSDKCRKPAKGTRDMLPEQMAIKEEAIQKIKAMYKKHGAVEIDTPVFERAAVLMGKYGEQQKLIYELNDQGGEALALRYDLTVPFARFLATHNITKIKRFHIGKVYRRDQPSIKTGRFREFYQCDFDIAGPSLPMLADAEVLKVFCDILEELQIEFKFKINDKRLLDLAIIEKAGCRRELYNTVCSSIDKLDKETWEKVAEELREKGLKEESVDEIHRFVTLNCEDNQKVLESLRSYFGQNDVINQIETLLGYIEALNISKYITFDTSLARGLDYYTGLIFEGVLHGQDSTFGIGSIAGGGRYDNLVGMFSPKQIPSVGGSIGIERIFTILEQRAKSSNLLPVFAFVGTVGEHVDRRHVLKVANWLWEERLSAEIFYEELQLKEQMGAADKRGAKVMVIVGEEELKSGEVVVRDLEKKGQVKVKMVKEDVMREVKKLTQ